MQAAGSNTVGSYTVVGTTDRRAAQVMGLWRPELALASLTDFTFRYLRCLERSETLVKGCDQRWRGIAKERLRLGAGA